MQCPCSAELVLQARVVLDGRAASVRGSGFRVRVRVRVRLRVGVRLRGRLRLRVRLRVRVRSSIGAVFYRLLNPPP